jgi:hypothetical protein
VLDPTTRSRTVPEVRISPGPAAPITRAAMCTAEREPPHDRRVGLNRRKVTDVQHLTAQPRRSAQRVF